MNNSYIRSVCHRHPRDSTYNSKSQVKFRKVGHAGKTKQQRGLTLDSSQGKPCLSALHLQLPCISCFLWLDPPLPRPLFRDVSYPFYASDAHNYSTNVYLINIIYGFQFGGYFKRKFYKICS